MSLIERLVGRWSLFVLVLATLVAWGAGSALAEEPPRFDPSRVGVIEGDIAVGPSPEAPQPQFGSVAEWSPVNSPFAADPFIAWRDVTSVTGDHDWEVWRCDSPSSPRAISVSTLVSYISAQATPYFDALSRGRYTPGFIGRSNFNVVDGLPAISACLYDSNTPYGWGRPAPEGRGYLAIAEDYGLTGVGTPGAWHWLSSGGVERWELVEATRQAAAGGAAGIVNASQFEYFVMPTVLHEIGHGLGWPHVPIRGDSDPYGNPLDIMSGPSSDPFVGTAAINLYATGWIDRSEVAVWNGGSNEYRLGTLPTGRTKMLILPTENPRVYHTVSVQPISYDSASPWGVVVHHVDQRDFGFQGYCPGANTCTLISRVVEILPPNGWNGFDLPMITPGRSLDESNWRVTIAASHSDGYTVSLRSTGFTDTRGHLFESEIDRIADAGITRGCNPPANSRFCPNSPVTRGQMAAFLVRALGLSTGNKVFSDTAGHLFQSEIARLEAAGITRGCNPPANTRFCPDDPVTRGQMAAFLVRALGLSTGDKVFSDTVGHLFEAEISRLEAAGITRGCNPPANTRFCPGDPVTRGQMAAFLVRAGLTD